MFSRKEIEGKVIDVVTETLALENPAGLEDSFREDLGADSIDIVTLLVSLQDEINRSFDVNDLYDKTKLIDIVNFIDELYTKEPSPA